MPEKLQLVNARPDAKERSNFIGNASYDAPANPTITELINGTPNE